MTAFLACSAGLGAGAALGSDLDFSSLAPYAGRTVTAVELSGNKVTKPYVIERELQTRIGEGFDPDRLRADLQRLENLSIFAEVGVEAEPDGEKGVRLRLLFREMPSWFPAGGFTYTEENGFSFGVGLSAGNLTGRNFKLSARAYFGGTTQYWARFAWPWISGNHLSAGFYGAHLVRDDTLNEFEENSDELTPRVGTYLGEHGRLGGMFSFFAMRSNVPDKTLSPDNEDILVRLGVSAGWDTRDSWRNPRNGWLNELELWRTGGFLGGDGSFWSMNLDLRRWFPTAPRQKLLVSSLLSLQSGVVGEDVPVYLIYRMGGANSIRGYDIDDLGQRLYGKNQLIGTLEYSFAIVPMRRWDFFKWSIRLGFELAVFADAGIAWDEPRQFAMDLARGGVGAGLRVLVPGTEMMRLDVGWSPEGGFQFHFGNWPKPTAQRFRVR